MKPSHWVQVAIIGLAATFILSSWANAAPTPNNCGVNMRCRVRALIASTLAITATTDLGTVTTNGSGVGSATVRSGAKCFCLSVNDSALPVCSVSGTTLSISGASAANDVNYFCPTTTQ